MKLSQVLAETQQFAGFRNKHAVDELANRLYEGGFPESFSLTLVSDMGHSFPATYELKDKRINDNPGYHLITFVYEMDSKASTLIHNAMMKTEDDEEYDALHDLNVDTFEVYAELDKEITKVYGHAK